MRLVATEYVSLGGDARLFDGSRSDPLRLTGSKSFGAGVVVLEYETAG